MISAGFRVERPFLWVSAHVGYLVFVFCISLYNMEPIFVFYNVFGYGERLIANIVVLMPEMMGHQPLSYLVFNPPQFSLRVIAGFI